VSLLSRGGDLLNVHGLSAAAERAGLTVAAILGSKAWGWNESAAERLLRDKHAEVLHENAPVEFETTSEIGGVGEHWHIHMEPVAEEPRPHVLCVGTEMFPGVTPSLTKPQRELLRMLADDWTYAEMATRVGVALTSLHQRLLTLRKRFNVHTNHGLVAAAGRHGLLT
jgi:DNA-binding CsgD family transcriptional regulator